MNKIIIRLADHYIKRPLFWDIIISAIFISVLIFIIENRGYFNLDVDVESIKSTLSDIITTSISLAGFVLASLTIIVTFKDNLSRKESSDGEGKNPNLNISSGIELLFNSKHYKRIVGVFTWAAFIFLFLFLIFSGIKMFTKGIHLHNLFYVSIAGILIIGLTIFRSLVVLYQVIKLQLKRN